MTRFYRIEGNPFTFACFFTILVSALSFVMVNDLYIISIIGGLGYILLFMAIMSIAVLIMFFFSPIYMSKRWYLGITKDGILDRAFWHKKFYPWGSIRSHELKRVQHHIPKRYFHTLILRLDSKTISIPLHKYGIDTESEASNFLSALETYFHSP